MLFQNVFKDGIGLGDGREISIETEKL